MKSLRAATRVETKRRANAKKTDDPTCMLTRCNDIIIYDSCHPISTSVSARFTASSFSRFLWPDSLTGSGKRDLRFSNGSRSKKMRNILDDEFAVKQVLYSVGVA